MILTLERTHLLIQMIWMIKLTARSISLDSILPHRALARILKLPRHFEKSARQEKVDAVGETQVIRVEVHETSRVGSRGLP